MNKDKTEGLWIGKLKHCKDKVGGIKKISISFNANGMS
jgi:hypothetical protein